MKCCDPSLNGKDKTRCYCTGLQKLRPGLPLTSVGWLQDIRDFFPLVFHEHPGATSIMQRLGEAVMQRLNQMEDNLKQLLDETQVNSESRLSRSDWDNVRKKLLQNWALEYHRIGRKGKLEVLPSKIVKTVRGLKL